MKTPRSAIPISNAQAGKHSRDEFFLVLRKAGNAKRR